MSTLKGKRPVYVVGIGIDPYSFPTERPFVELGLSAVRTALADCGAQWPQVESAYVGTSSIGMAVGRVMFRHLGSTGLAVTQVENASASGSSAFRMACLDVASGVSDICLAVGVDKTGDGKRAASKDGLEGLSPTRAIPAVRFALLADRYCKTYGVDPVVLAQVAVKNHGNAAKNPFAQFRKERTIESVMGSTRIVGDITQQQCCPRGEGAAAAIVVSEEGLKRLGLSGDRAVRVAASVSTSETVGTPTKPSMIEIVRHSTEAVLAEAGVTPKDLDMIELHDAFSIEELLYTECMGICGEGQAGDYLMSGATQIGGECAVNASGGLIGMGHPIGPTGLGQVCEITRQMRGEAEGRQHPNTKTALAHMVGLGTIAVGHVLVKD